MEKPFKFRDVIITVPLVHIKTRTEPTPVIRNSYGEIVHCLIVRVDNDEKSIEDAKKESDCVVKGSDGLTNWFKSIKQKYDVLTA